jgi:hypothetical protein
MSVALRTSLETKDVNHVYYNATLTNTTSGQIPATIIDTRSEPLLQNPEDWEMSVIRFDVSAQTVPLTIVNIVSPGVIDPTTPLTLLTQFLFATLTVGGIDYTVQVSLTPSASYVQQPIGAIFNFQKLLDDVNAAFSAAYNLIPVLMRPAGSAPPQFIWNPNTQLIDLYVDGNYLSPEQVPPYSLPTIQIWVSTALWDYLTGFNAFQNAMYSVSHKDVRIEGRRSTAIVLPAFGLRDGFPVSVASINTPLYSIQQEAQQTQNWNDARSLLITSSLLPVRPEYVPTSFTTSNNSVSTATQRIVSDFLVPEEQNLLQSRNVFQYLPTAQYRMLDLYGKAPFFTIDLTMNWTDFAGDLFTLLLNPGAGLSVKILFRRKGYCSCSDSGAKAY